MSYTVRRIEEYKMIDDSLSDTQQEKKMSVKELHFEGKSYDLNISFENNKLIINMQEEGFELDRSQAHLLMLYLQEHLSPQPVSKEYWECGCGLSHPKGYVCTRLIR